MRLTRFVSLLTLGAALCATGAAQDARAIVARAVAADNRSDRLARDYTYKVRDEIIEHDKDGRVKSTQSTLDEVLYIGGKRYFHPLEKDGKPLRAAQQRSEDAKLDRAVKDANRMTEAERNKQLADAERDRAKQRADFKDIPDAFDFRLIGDDTIDGRETYKITATPKPSYRGKLRSILNNIEGTVWIDKADFNWVKFEAEVLNTFRIGWFLARVDKGTHISYRMTRVNDELWAPADVTLNASARLALVKKVNVEQHVTFSDYRKFQTDSKIIATDADDSR